MLWEAEKAQQELQCSDRVIIKGGIGVGIVFAACAMAKIISILGRGRSDGLGFYYWLVGQFPAVCDLPNDFDH